nr:PREDICTED: coiled-coil domain-containing protein 62 isoform X3 [Lepisosteus oculatus]
MDPWHSTPVKKHSFKSLTESQPPPTRLHFGSAVTLQTEDPLQDLPSDCPQPITGRKHVHKAAVEIESATIQKQRKELQLLVAELKDRDRELNSMVSAHQKQLLAWEEDRQKVLTLEQRCARFENELQKRNEIIRAVTKRIRILEAQQLDRQSALSSTQQLLQDLSEREQETSSQCQDLQEKNQSLNSSVLELSTQIGQLQAREQELGAMLKLKDEDVVEATRHIVDLTGRLRKLEAAVKECRLREDRALKEAQEYKRQLREARREAAKLRDDLQEKTAENNNQKEDVIRLKQEIQLLQSELALAGEGERRKDELLELARSKQERTEMELHCLRQVYENQQNDLQLLQLNLESSQERLKEREGRAQEGSQGRLDLGSLHLDSSAVWGGSSPASNRRKQRGSPRLGNGTLELAVSPPKDTVNGEGGPSSAPANSDEQPSLTRLLRLVAESRQMVADLEISTMRPASPAHSLDSSGSSRSVEALDSREQFLRDTQLLEGSTHSKHQNSCSKRSVAGSLLNLDTQQLPVNL